jgi:hypothetical protein
MPIWSEFVGPAYKTQSLYAGDQLAINLYPEKVDFEEKTKINYYSTPGCGVAFATLAAGSEVRGCWVLPGGQSSLWVCGSGVYLVTITGAVTSVGTVNSSAGQVRMRDNTIAVELTDGDQQWTYTIASGAFAQNAAANALFTSKTIEYADGFFVTFNVNSQVFYMSDVNNTTYSLPYFASKSGDSDNVVGGVFFDRQLFLIGERTTELWYDVGGATLPYNRIEGAFLQYGCAAPYTIAVLKTGVIWLTRDARGFAEVWRTEGFTPERVSTHAMEYVWQSYTSVTDALAWTYQHNGHEFYVLTFPSANLGYGATWVYDTTTGLWHQRGWWDAANSRFHRARLNCVCVMGSLVLVGDYANGNIYQLSDSVYTEAGGTPLVRVRRAPHVQSDHVQLFFERLQVEFEPGVGLSSGQGSNPQAMLKWSDDGGSSWSSEHWTSIGVQGNYLNRALWVSLGSARDRIFEVRVSDPVKCNIINATLEVSEGAH